MNGTASDETSAVNRAAIARKAAPKTSTPAVDARVSRAPASATFQPACRNAAPSARASAPASTAYECSGSFIDSVSGASM